MVICGPLGDGRSFDLSVQVANYGVTVQPHRRASRTFVATCPDTTEDRYGRTHQQVPSMFATEADLV